MIFFNGISKWTTISKSNPAAEYIVYGGTRAQKRSEGNVIGWQKAGGLILSTEK